MQTESAELGSRGKHGTKRDPERTKGKRLSLTETVEILSLHKRGISQSEIARAMGIAVQRVNAKILAYSSTTHTAMQVLQAHSHAAAEEWVKSFTAARKRGEHRPMKDCLIATGVVSPDPINQGVTVVIGAGDVAAITQAHNKAVIDVNTLSETQHNPTSSTPLLGEPYSVRLSEEVDK